MRRNRSTRDVLGVVALALPVALAAGCGGQKGTLTVSIITPTGVDPFANAAKVHVWAGDPSLGDATATVSGGHFNAQFSFTPPSGGAAGQVHVEVLDGNGNAISRGASPTIGIQPADGNVSVFVSPIGQVTLAPTSLTKPVTAAAIAEVPGLGPVVVGGLDANGAQATDVEVMPLYSWAIEAGASLSAPQPGAVAVGVPRPADATGYLLLLGGTTQSAGPLAFFEPLEGTQGTWTPSIATSASLVRSSPAVTTLADGTLLVTGGTDGNSAPLATAATITTGSSYTISSVTAAMAAPRAGHTIVAANVAGGAGALLFGGDAMGAAGAPAVETYQAAARTFTGQPALALPSRTGHAAVLRSTGTVLIVGGTGVANGVATALDDAIEIDPATLVVTPHPKLLSTPRTGLTATVAGSTLLVCGGRDAQGTPLASCDVIDEKSLIPRSPEAIPLAGPRADHAALAVETGNVVLVGGVGGDGKPNAAIEVFTY